MTWIVLAHRLEKEGKIVTSLKHYQAALSTDQEFPERKIAMERLTTLKGVLERQVPSMGDEWQFCYLLLVSCVPVCMRLC